MRIRGRPSRARTSSGPFRLGYKSVVRLRDSSGPTGTDDDTVLRRYASAVGLDLATNTFAERDCWLIAARKTLLMMPSGMVAGLSAQPSWKFDRTGARLTHLEHRSNTGEAVTMVHLAMADGRFILGDVYHSDDGDLDRFVAAFEPSVRRVDDELARHVLQPA